MSFELDYKKNLDNWIMVSDICSGEYMQYIMMLHPEDRSPENEAVNRQYKKTAVFYNYSGRTLHGMVGLAFRKDPRLTIPDEIDYIKKSIDGGALSVYQQAQKALSEVLMKDRVGLWVDYPAFEGDQRPTSLELAQRKYFSTVYMVKAEQITNIEETFDGATVKKSLVDIQSAEIDDAGKEFTKITRLRLTDGKYSIQEYKKNGDKEEPLTDERFPRDYRGRNFDHIPFHIAGSVDNSLDVTESPLLPIVRINVGHLNNSASYEQMLRMIGQPQPYATGVDEQWYSMVTELNDNKKIYMGCNFLLPLPQSATLGYATIQGDKTIADAMREKKEDIVALGGMLIAPSNAGKTATEAEGDEQVLHSVLSVACSNVSEAYTACIKDMLLYMSPNEYSEEDANFTINKDFVQAGEDANYYRELAKSWQDGSLRGVDLVRYQQKVGLVNPEEDPEEVAQEYNAARGLSIDLGGE